MTNDGAPGQIGAGNPDHGGPLPSPKDGDHPAPPSFATPKILNPVADQGFSLDGTNYHDTRPTYPDTAVAHILENVGAALAVDSTNIGCRCLNRRIDVLEVAAGTGLFTKAWLKGIQKWNGEGARASEQLEQRLESSSVSRLETLLEAVEPVDAMRAEFEKAFPRVRIQPGVCSALPRPDNSADVVVIAQGRPDNNALLKVGTLLRTGLLGPSRPVRRN